jgi:hypothetical protein
LIETQLAPFDIEGRIEWGTWTTFGDVLGFLTLVRDQDNAEGDLTDLALVPSPGVLKRFLPSLGFARLEVVLPPDARAERLARGSRAVVVAYR